MLSCCLKVPCCRNGFISQVSETVSVLSEGSKDWAYKAIQEGLQEPKKVIVIPLRGPKLQ